MNRREPVTVRETLNLLRRWRAQLIAGERGLGRTVTWASIMRARTPAFEGFQGGELALLSLTTLHSLRSQLVAPSLPEVVDEVIGMGASAIAVSGLEDQAVSGSDDARERDEACQRAERMGAAIPDTVVRVAESGVRDADDAKRLADAGYDAVLVGETLVRAPDPSAMVRALRCS